MSVQLRRHQLLFSVVTLTAIIAGGLFVQFQQPLSAAMEVAKTAKQPPPQENLEDFMKSKLAAINAAMESAATDDFIAVEKAGMDLILLSKRAAWTRQANAAYLQDTADFVQAAEFMVRMANAEDSQGVAHSYGAVAACCLNCHRHVRQPKVAVIDPPSSQNLAMAAQGGP